MKTPKALAALLGTLLAASLPVAQAQETDEVIIPAPDAEPAEVQEAELQETVEDLAEGAETAEAGTGDVIEPGDAPELQAQPAMTPPAGAQDLPTREDQKQMAPFKSYLQARQNLQQAPDLMGGPIKIVITQEQGGAHAALPAPRELDPTVFGTPDLPRQYGGEPVITGLPLQMRGVENGRYTQTTEPTPFGDATVVMSNGSMTLVAVDAQSVDGATTRDSLSFRGSWEDADGNTYSITCSNALSQGFEYPFFGGVVTNHVLHGASGIGTPLLPTLFAYMAFWGIGEVDKNGETVAENQLIHGMLTEYVRGENYELVFDENVEPERRHFHILAAPVQVVDGQPSPQPVSTGFTLENGEELPFWHVMFADLNIETEYIQAGD
jgi:hypothetical protein